MKRFACFVFAMVLMMGVFSITAGADEPFRFTRENFPRMDGSTSLVPLGIGIASVLLGESRQDAASLIGFNRTTQSFRNLADGLCDIVIAAEPKSEVFDQMAANQFAYEIEQIAKEALVFVVNADNPVNSLTIDQVQKIYTGEITNWAQVGGADAPIEAFQRNATAGSQVMMEKLVMQGKKMMEVPTTQVPGEMAQLIEAVKNYDNSANAIGYTVYYYAADMQMASGLKILQIDGVIPNPQSLQDESYPFINGYYACIGANAGESARMLYRWLLSEAGQRLLELEGYVPVYAAGEAPESGDDVAVDYSNFTPNGGQEAKFTWFDCSHDTFEPRGDYGDIYPYEGEKFYADYEYEGESYDFQAAGSYGFYNHKGELITKPIFTAIQRVGVDGYDSREYFWRVTEAGGMTGFVTKDGSVFSGACYLNFYSVGDKFLGIRNEAQTEFDVFDKQLNLIKTQADFTIDGRVYLPMECSGSLICCIDSAGFWDGDTTHYAILNDEQQVLLESGNYLGISGGLLLQYDEDWHAAMLYRDLTPVVDPSLGEYALTILNDSFYRIQADTRDFIIDRNGSEFEWDYDDVEYGWDDGFRVVRGDICTVYASNGKTLFQNVPTDWDYWGEGVFVASIHGGGVTIHHLPDGNSRSFPEASYGYRAGSLVYVVMPDDIVEILDLNLNTMNRFSGNVYDRADLFTGKNYVVCHGANGFSNETTVFREDCRTELIRVNGEVDLQGDAITVSNNWAFYAYDMTGNLIFCYPYYGMNSGD